MSKKKILIFLKNLYKSRGCLLSTRWGYERENTDEGIYGYGWGETLGAAHRFPDVKNGNQSDGDLIPTITRARVSSCMHSHAISMTQPTTWADLSFDKLAHFD